MDAKYREVTLPSGAVVQVRSDPPRLGDIRALAEELMEVFGDGEDLSLDAVWAHAPALLGHVVRGLDCELDDMDARDAAALMGPVLDWLKQIPVEAFLAQAKNVRGLIGAWAGDMRVLMGLQPESEPGSAPPMDGP